MTQRRNHPVWTNLEEAVHDAMKSYIMDSGQSISEFVRVAIAEKLLAENYLAQEQLELVLYGV